MKTTKMEMINSIVGYAQLNLYKNSSVEELSKWSSTLELNFNLEEIKTNKDRNSLLITYFLFNPITKGFLSNLEHFKNDLLIKSSNDENTYYGYIKGSVNWGQSYNARLTKGNVNAPIFICNTQKRELDTIPNRLFKYLLLNISNYITKYIPRGNSNSEWLDSIISIHENIKSFEKYKYMKEITNINNISLKYKIALKATKKKHYQSLYKCLILFESIFINNDKDQINLLLIERALISKDNNKLFEIFTLFRLYKILDNYSINKKYNILGLNGTSSPCSIYYFSKGYIEVRFQTLPTYIHNSGEYSEIINNSFDISITHNRCPDIFMTWVNYSDKSRHDIFIEVKYSENIEYYYDSIYKVFGYLYDFGEGLIKKPKGILVFDSGINSSSTDNLKITNSSDFDKCIREVLHIWKVI